jgi:hypothetical protein
LNPQSVWTEQPHTLLPPPLVMHVGPTVDAVQLVHSAPAAPQAAFWSPGWQVPLVALEQHAPLHGWFVEHAVVHFFVVALQACPTGQLVDP